MFKRVKSLVLAGALVLGMTVSVFAEVNPNKPVGYENLSKSEQATFDHIEPKYHAAITVGTHDDTTRTRVIEMADFVTQNEWNRFIGDINTDIKDGLNVREVADSKMNGYKMYEVIFDKNFNGVADGEDGNEVIMETVFIVFNETSHEGKGEFKITIAPDTGDVIAYSGLGLAAIAGAGLYISNKKRK